ncbi:DUF29 domain-containing protein [Sphaerospermopsis sp. FACHB-1194]|uniref:DUF29 domain-containing protein n=1 Tax=Sphaerospermopsis sp. FACHB-1194 TaxID=2692862 RepID=UPI00168065EF|nr:DUF29 domain-containing protein [Sphaerospermopsis sp. FACHB-1194]MBD2148108.1 DUF29 domain-containing protein [Sphaerospermopsis sp. FACHB-1194]
MRAELKNKIKNLYDADYNLWVLETVKQLENRDLDSLDWDNLIEEVLDLSKRDKRKIESLLMKLIEHLLILQYWQGENERNRGHWQREITNFRKQIKRLLADSPSLKNHLEMKLELCYNDGRELASQHSQLPLNTFPEEAIATLEKFLDDHWFANT